MAAGLAMLEILEGNDALYRQLDQTGQEIQDGISALLRSAGIPAQVNRVGSMLTVFFTDEAVTDLKTAKTSDTAKFASFFRHLLNQGVYLPPSQFEAWFVSAAIGDREKELLFKATKSFSTI
jgi:glutamate-1-semialdehyde 2,1-aminomutase